MVISIFQYTFGPQRPGESLNNWCSSSSAVRRYRLRSRWKGPLNNRTPRRYGGFTFAHMCMFNVLGMYMYMKNLVMVGPDVQCICVAFLTTCEEIARSSWESENSFGLQKAMTHLKLLNSAYSHHTLPDILRYTCTPHNNYSKIKTRIISYTVKSTCTTHTLFIVHTHVYIHWSSGSKSTSS